MFERFTDRSRRAVVLAQEESRRRGHREIDAGHIVLGALTASEGAGLDPSDIDAVRRGAESTFGDRAVDHGHAEHLPFTSAAKAALEQPSLAGALTAAGADPDQLRSTITAGHAAASEAADEPNASLVAEGSSQVIIDLPRQILQRLDTIVERLEHGGPP